MRILGLDIGIASVGYAIVDMEGATIERVGVRLFDKAEEPKTGAPLAGPRRDARHARRTIRRRAGRMKAIRRLFELDALPHYSADITDETLKAMSQQSQEATPWELRADGLKRLLSKQELARVLYHIAKHRGFQSTKKGEAKEAGSEAGKMLSKASEIKSALEASGHKTIGAYFYYEKLLKGQRVRNGTDNYSNTILRQLHRDEIDALVKAQQGYGATWLSEAWVEKYKHMAFHQAPLKSVEGMVGKCSLLPDQPRAPRMSRSAELFVLWQNINHLRLSGPRGLERGLEADEREFLFNAAHDLKQLTYEQIRQKLKIEPDWRFKNLFYRQPKKKAKSDDAPVAEQDIVKVTEKKKFIALDGYHTLKTILGEQPSGEQVHVWDEVARILSFEQSEDAIRDELWKWNQAHQTPLTQDQIERLAKIDNFKGTVHHSVEAIQRLLPFLEAGETYDKAVVLGNFTNKAVTKQTKLPPFMPEFGCDDIRNPVVTRALAQVRKVVNALVREHGMPDRIHIELAREFNRSFDDRQKIRRDQEENRSLNEAIDKEIESNFGHRAIDPQVYKLWKEQNGRCLYSNQAISPNELMDRLALQIDHALPYSRSYDNGYFNKVLVKTTENQRKGNRTVWEYFRAEKSPDDWERLEAQIQHLPKPKRDRILNQSFGETEQDWKERHLNDTRWITRAVKNHIEKHLDLPVAENQRGVVCLNGSVTHYLRGQWGLNKNRDENARHHGQDAIVIACCTTNMVQRVATYQRYQDRLAGRRPNVPKPWEGFREEVIDKTSQIFVSRAPRRKVTGEINSPNPERTRLNPSTEKVEVIKRVALPSLNLKKLEQLVDKESANQPLYTALKQRLEAFEGKGDKAFKEPFYFAETPHAEPRLVYKVSVWDGPSSGIPVRGGLVSNGDMIRVDVFQKLGKYYLVPVYARDFIIGTLPNRCIVAYKPEEEWPEANEALGYAFLFTLYPNDFVRLTNKEGEVIEGYYVATDRSTASIVIKTHDDSLGFVVANRLSKECKVGVQRLKCFDKYAIGVLGEQTLIKREKRDELANRTDSKSC